MTPNLSMRGEISVNPTDYQLGNAQGKMKPNVHCSFGFCKHDLDKKWKNSLKLETLMMFMMWWDASYYLGFISCLFLQAEVVFLVLAYQDNSIVWGGGRRYILLSIMNFRDGDGCSSLLRDYCLLLLTPVFKSPN